MGGTSSAEDFAELDFPDLAAGEDMDVNLTKIRASDSRGHANF
jgi:hypothetical protein